LGGSGREGDRVPVLLSGNTRPFSITCMWKNREEEGQRGGKGGKGAFLSVPCEITLLQRKGEKSREGGGLKKKGQTVKCVIVHPESTKQFSAKEKRGGRTIRAEGKKESAFSLLRVEKSILLSTHSRKGRKGGQ